MNASSYRGGAIPFLRLFSISFVPFPFHYNECFFVHQFGKGGRVSGGATYDGYVSEISGLDDRADELVQEVRNFKTADGAQAWKTLEKKIETLEDELERLEDKIERSYRDGKLTTTEFRALDRLLDQTDDKIDDLDDRYDDWYDDHDDDRDDDWDDDHDDWDD